MCTCIELNICFPLNTILESVKEGWLAQGYNEVSVYRFFSSYRLVNQVAKTSLEENLKNKYMLLTLTFTM